VTTAQVVPVPTAEPDPALLAAAVLACPAVAGLASSPATYLPGSRVDGIVVGDRVGVHLVLRWPSTVFEAAAQVRAAVRPLAGGRGVDIDVTDVTDVLA